MPTAPPEYRVQPPRNGLGTAGFVLGLIGLLFSFLPVVGVVAWPLVILGLIFSLIGVYRAVKGRATNKGLSIAGVILSVIGLVICIVWVSATAKAANDVTKQANETVTIGYDAGGTAKGATVTYSTFSDGASADGQVTTNLPWHKDVQATGFARGGVLTVTAGMDGGTVSCKVTVDGTVQKTSTASGPLASATCSDF
jgi:amino acid transporter